MHYKATRGAVTSPEWKLNTAAEINDFEQGTKSGLGHRVNNISLSPKLKLASKKPSKNWHVFNRNFVIVLTTNFLRFRWVFWKSQKTHRFARCPGRQNQGCQMFTFQTQFGYISEDLGMENVSGHLEYFTTIGYIMYGHLVILLSFGIFFTRFGTLYQVKSGNPGQNCVFPEPRWWIQFSTFLERSNSDAKPLEYLVRTWLTFRNCDWNSWDGFLAPLVFCIALNHFNLQG
jgi:hypothetical protein